MPHTQTSPHCESEHGSVHDLVVKPDILSSQLQPVQTEMHPTYLCSFAQSNGMQGDMKNRCNENHSSEL